MTKCSCPTCCIVAAMIQGELVKRGWSREVADSVTVTGGLDGPHPALAHVMVGNREVYRIHRTPDEALDPDVLADIERALPRCAVC